MSSRPWFECYRTMLQQIYSAHVKNVHTSNEARPRDTAKMATAFLPEKTPHMENVDEEYEKSKKQRRWDR